MGRGRARRGCGRGLTFNTVADGRSYLAHSAKPGGLVAATTGIALLVAVDGALGPPMLVAGSVLMRFRRCAAR